MKCLKLAVKIHNSQHLNGELTFNLEIQVRVAKLLPARFINEEGFKNRLYSLPDYDSCVIDEETPAEEQAEANSMNEVIVRNLNIDKPQRKPKTAFIRNIPIELPLESLFASVNCYNLILDEFKSVFAFKTL